MKWLAMVLLLLLLSSCGGTTSYNDLPKVSTDDLVALSSNNIHNSITVYHDDKRGVTCWVYRGYEEGSISCIPDSQLKDK